MMSASLSLILLPLLLVMVSRFVTRVLMVVISSLMDATAIERAFSVA
jgi:hypothetical protein